MTRTLCLCLCLALSILAPAAATAGTARCEAALTPALQQLLDWPREAWRFAVAEHRPSGKFVQFGYDQGLFIDLPIVSLSDGEQASIKALLEATGGGGPRRMESTDPATGAPIWFDTLHRHFGTQSDVAAAAHLGCRVLAEVFAVPDDAELDIVVDGDL